MSRVDQYHIHLSNVGGRDCGVWQTKGGGGVDSEEAFTRDDFGLPREALGGQATITNHTLARTYRIDRDPDLYRFLRRAAGNKRCSGTAQLVDPDGFAVGVPEPFQGMLKAANKDDANVEGSDTMKVNIEISADGPVSW